MEEAGNLPEPRPRTGTNGGILHCMLPTYLMDIACQAGLSRIYLPLICGMTGRES